MRVQGLWIGSKLTDLHILCVNSFLKLDYQFDIYVYDKVENMPDGVRILDANSIIDKKFIYKFDNSYAGFSDFFRYKLLMEKGGWWVDLDIFCLRPLDDKDEIVLGLEKKSSSITQVQTNPIKFPMKDKLITSIYKDVYLKLLTRMIFETIFLNNQSLRLSSSNIYEKLQLLDDDNLVVDKRVEFKNDDNLNFYEFCLCCNLDPSDYKGQKTWSSFGPELLNIYVHKYDYHKYKKPVEYFNSIGWYEINKYLDNKFDYKSLIDNPNVYVLDLYATMWRNKHIEINDARGDCLINYMKTLVNFKENVKQVEAEPLKRQSLSDERSSSKQLPLNICFSVDINEAKYVPTIINSILSNSKSNIIFNVLCDNDNSVDTIKNLITKIQYKVNINYDIIREEEREFIDNNMRVIHSQYIKNTMNFARFYLSNHFKVDSFLYMDVDMIVNGDIYKIINDIDLKSKPLWAVPKMYNEYKVEFLEKIRPKDYCYFNAGLYYVDCNYWVENRYEEKFKQYMIKHKQSVNPLFTLGTQPIINILYFNNYGYLDTKYNVMDLGWKKDLDKKNINNGIVLHWNGENKGWNETNVYKQYWEKYKI
jgi:predicted transcriptional regulator